MIRLLRGAENDKYFSNFGYVVFSASVWEEEDFIAHAVLRHLEPGHPQCMELRHIPVELSHVHTVPKHRRHGHGELVVKHCLTYATRRQLDVVLRIAPYGGRSMSTVALTAWYERFGFRAGDDYFIRDYRR